MREIKIWKDPYGEGFDTTKKRIINFEPGITILTGCNGLGKSTLLKNIEKQLKREEIPCYKYDNLHDGGYKSISKNVFDNNIKIAANMMCASEGENISNNIFSIASEIGLFIKNGKRKRDPVLDVIKPENNIINCNERWLLFDGVDSGYSIDNIIEFKDFMHCILDNEKDREIYIIITSNSYEMTIGEKCLDVNSGKERIFKTYDSFKKYILKSKEIKEERYKKEKI